jgi:hypothetical protein
MKSQRYNLLVILIFASCFQNSMSATDSMSTTDSIRRINDSVTLYFLNSVTLKYYKVLVGR